MAQIIKVEGVEKTMAILRRMERKIQRKVLRKAGTAGGTLAVKAIKAAAPKTNRGLAKSITKKIQVDPNRGSVVVISGQDLGKVRKGGANAKKRLRGGGISGKGNIVPSHLVENPIRGHLQSGTLQKFAVGRGFVFTRSVTHPGTKGSFFVRRAAQQSKRSVMAAIESKMKIEVAAEADRARSGG